MLLNFDYSLNPFKKADKHEESGQFWLENNKRKSQAKFINLISV
jgi:hypothetical protein